MINSRCLVKIVLYKYFVIKNNFLNIYFKLYNKINVILFVLKKVQKISKGVFFYYINLKIKKKVK